MYLKIKIVLFLWLFTSQVYAQIKNTPVKESYFNAASGVSFSFLSFNNSDLTYQITSKPSDEELFFSNSNVIFVSFGNGKREHLLTYERGYGKHKLNGIYKEELKISYSKINYIFYFSKIGSSFDKIDLSFGIISSFISGNIRREWSNTIRVYQGIESDFNDLGFGFSLFSSYGFQKFNLFLSTDTILYIDNVIPSYILTFGILSRIY